MNTDHHTCSWLLESQLAPFVDAFMLHLFDCRYAFNTIKVMGQMCNFLV
jgi:integrase/recombinase XerC